MEDAKILDLYFARDEDAIRETDTAYGKRLHTLAKNILQNREDAEESVNDTYGHLAGEAALRQTAAVLRNAFRSHDLIGRLGGRRVRRVHLRVHRAQPAGRALQPPC